MLNMEKQIVKLNEFLSAWKGADARFNSYAEGHDRLVVALYKPGVASTATVGVAFTNCLYISGPTSWKNADLSADAVELDDGEPGVEIRDGTSKFVVRCGGVVVGNGELTIPRT